MVCVKCFFKEFFISLPTNDHRLHLLAIERNPSIGTAIDHKSLSIRLDNDMRTVFGVDEISFGHIGNIGVRISPIVTLETEEQQDRNSPENAGCISGEFFLETIEFHDKIMLSYFQKWR